MIEEKEPHTSLPPHLQVAKEYLNTILQNPVQPIEFKTWALQNLRTKRT